ncbi:MAG: hypothetical protein K0U41_06505 [Gammaproteobacteria bacterium]|nr:hypothetical protein [Gammaproteobacteria bacterium]
MARRVPTNNGGNQTEGFVNVSYKDIAKLPSTDPADKGKLVDTEINVQIGGIAFGPNNPRKAPISPNTKTERPKTYEELVLGNASKDKILEILGTMEPGEVRELPIQKTIVLTLRKLSDEPDTNSAEVAEKVPF